MFEAGLIGLVKKMLDAIKDLVTDANFEYLDDGICVQTMETSQVCMIPFFLDRMGFDMYNFDEDVKLGVILNNMSKMLKSAGMTMHYY